MQRRDNFGLSYYSGYPVVGRVLVLGWVFFCCCCFVGVFFLFVLFSVGFVLRGGGPHNCAIFPTRFFETVRKWVAHIILMFHSTKNSKLNSIFDNAVAETGTSGSQFMRECFHGTH